MAPSAGKADYAAEKPTPHLVNPAELGSRSKAPAAPTATADRQHLLWARASAQCHRCLAPCFWIIWEDFSSLLFPFLCPPHPTSSLSFTDKEGTFLL